MVYIGFFAVVVSISGFGVVFVYSRGDEVGGFWFFCIVIFIVLGI